MSEAEDRSKSKEVRLEEKGKVEAETQRSLAVAEMKRAHKLIEEAEKARKRPVLQSVCLRIDVHIKLLTNAAQMYGKPPFTDHLLSDPTLDYISGLHQIYESIRFDFQKNMEIKNEEMSIMFPKIELRTKDAYSVTASFAKMGQQLAQMHLYCQRILLG